MTTTVDPEKLRICPLTRAICDEKCAWFYKITTQEGRCVLVLLYEALRHRKI